MSIQIYSAIWPYILKCCAFKILWVFLFVTVCISSFLVVMFKSRKEDLKKSVLPQNKSENMHDHIYGIKEDLRLKKAKNECNLRKMNKKSSLRNLQRNLINNLKKDVENTEQELLELENEIELLSKKKENIKYEVTKQREEYEKWMEMFPSEHRY